jgi:hypothetical protein
MTRFKSIDDLPALLTPLDFAALTGICVQTQANWRNQRINGLQYVKCGRLVRYRRNDVLAWLKSRTVGGHDPTS